MFALDIHAMKEFQLLGNFILRTSTRAYPWTLLHFQDPDFGPLRCRNLAPPLCFPIPDIIYRVPKRVPPNFVKSQPIVKILSPLEREGNFQ